MGAARRRVPRRARGAPGRRPRRRRRRRRSGRRRANARDPPPGGERARRRLRRRAVQEAAEQSWRRLREAACRRRRRRRRRQAGRADRLQPPAQPMTRSCTLQRQGRGGSLSLLLCVRRARASFHGGLVGGARGSVAEENSMATDLASLQLGRSRIIVAYITSYY